MDTPTNKTLHLIGWAGLTFIWLSTNWLFFEAIGDAIHQHNAQIRRKVFEEIKEVLRENAKDESGGESEYESADEGEAEGKDEC